MTATACPTDHQLREFHDGSLSEPELDAIANHLAGCSTCEAAISRIEAGPATDALHVGFRALRSDLYATAVDPSVPIVAAPPQRCGHYELRDRVGVGGMGVVYRAWDPRLKRFAAVKVLRAGGDARPDELSRFQREAELLARLRHPNLVEVYEAGVHDRQPYLAMELVDGGSLADRLDTGPLEPRAAAELVRSVARAVHVAHLSGITHRDIKPANILLATNESQGSGVGRTTVITPVPTSLTPKLSDFGLARLDDPTARLTQTGLAAGTPAYMAPEQADPRVGSIGPAADVWALGAVLYECLSGHPPFVGDDPTDVFRKLLEQDPPSLADAPRDLAVICSKCLRKAPSDRYSTGGDLADDLDRFLNGEPVRARPVSTMEAVWKWAKRRPWVAGLAAGLAGVTLLGTIGITLALVYALNGWNAAANREHDAVVARDRAERQLYFSRVAQAELRWRANDVQTAAALLAECRPHLRGWEWDYLQGLMRPGVARADALSAAGEWHPGVGYVDDLTFTADGSALVTAGGGNPFRDAAASGNASVRFWDPTTARPIGPPLIARTGLRAVAVSPDGQTVAALERTGTVRRWATDGRDLGAAGGMPTVGRVFFMPDGGLRLVSSRNTDGRPRNVVIECWDGETGRRLWSHEAPQATSPSTATLTAVSGDRVAVGLLGIDGGDGRVIILDVRSGAAIGEPLLLGADPTAVALSADASRVAVMARRLRVVNVASRQEVWSTPLPAGCRALAFSPDGRTVAAGLADRTICTFAADNGTLIGTWRGNSGRVMALAFHPDGRRLAAGSEQEGGWVFWDLARHQECILAQVGRDDRSAEGIAFAAGGDELLAAVPMLPIRAVDATTGAIRSGTSVPLTTRWQSPGTLATFAKDGTILVGVGGDQTAVTIWDAVSSKEQSVLTGLGAQVQRLAVTPDGRRVAAVGVRRDQNVPARLLREIRVWDTASSTALFQRSAPVGYPLCTVAFSADGNRLVFADTPADAPPAADGDEPPNTVRVIDLPTGRELWAVGNQAPMLSLTFDASGGRLAGGDRAGNVRIWDAATGRDLMPAPLSGPGWGLAFSPDGTRLAGVDRDRVRLWDASSGDEVLDLGGVPARPGDDGYNPQVIWSPDGRRLAAIRGRGNVAIWEARSHR
jgi:WD40 repeat protein